MDTPDPINQQLLHLMQRGKAIVLFDGVCNFCSSGINFIIKHDKRQRYYFIPLQEAIGKHILAYYQLPDNYLDSLLLLERGKLYTHSTAAIRIAMGFGGVWHIMQLLLFIPSVVRNALYCLIARNRYRLFGKRTHCMLPSPQLRRRFLLTEADLQQISKLYYT